MKKERVDYILKNYHDFINKEEEEILNRLHDYGNFVYMKEIIGEDEVKTKYDLFNLNEKWIKYFQEHSVDEIRESIAQNILLRHEKEIMFITCPICGGMVRTLLGRQCINGHQW